MDWRLTCLIMNHDAAPDDSAGLSCHRSLKARHLYYRNRLFLTAADGGQRKAGLGVA